MLLLALDTSTSSIGVALHDGRRVLAARSVLEARRHTEQLAPLVVEVLAAAAVTPTEVTDVVVGTGPGPFTGLRVGIVTARTFAFARGIPVHGVCSLDVLATQAGGSVAGSFLVATDARRKEVYWATYAAQSGSVARLTDPAVDRPAELPDDVRALPTAGRGPVLYPDLLPHGLPVLDVEAGVLAEVAVARLAAAEPMPVQALYLRRPDTAPAAAAKSTVPDGWRHG